MKAPSRLVSPAGFGLVLLLFLFLPFLSVSCQAPGAGTVGAKYTGLRLATGGSPDVQFPKDMEDLAKLLPADRDAGVSALAIVVVLLLVAGIASALVPRPRVRQLAAPAIAVVTAGMMVVIKIVGQANLNDLVDTAWVRLAEGKVRTNDGAMYGFGCGGIRGVPTVGDCQLVHTGVGFWLCVVGLAGVALLSAGLALRKPDLTST